MMKMRKLDE